MKQRMVMSRWSDEDDEGYWRAIIGWVEIKDIQHLFINSMHPIFSFATIPYFNLRTSYYVVKLLIYSIFFNSFYIIKY